MPVEVIKPEQPGAITADCNCARCGSQLRYSITESTIMHNEVMLRVVKCPVCEFQTAFTPVVDEKIAAATPTKKAEPVVAKPEPATHEPSVASKPRSGWKK